VSSPGRPIFASHTHTTLPGAPFPASSIIALRWLEAPAASTRSQHPVTHRSLGACGRRRTETNSDGQSRRGELRIREPYGIEDRGKLPSTPPAITPPLDRSVASTATTAR